METCKNGILYVKRLVEGAKIPSKRKEDSGYDLYSVHEEEVIFLLPGESHLFPTGIAVQLPIGYGFVVANRGGNGSKGMVYGAHIVDSGYRGGVFLDLHNISDKLLVVSRLDKKEVDKAVMEKYGVIMPWLAEEDECYILINSNKALAQALILRTEDWDVVEVDTLSDSERGEGALGSSNK